MTQTHRLFSNLTVEETIRFQVLFGKRKPLLAFDELVELLSIEKLLERRPKSFPDSCWAFRAQAAKSASP